MMKQAKKAKRLQPLPETLRRLFLTSGNVCAFPGCRELMIDLAGHFVGQLCHVEAGVAESASQALDRGDLLSWTHSADNGRLAPQG